MPVVLVPAPVSDTAKPAVRAKFPPLVMGRTTGTFVTRLNASGETIRTGRRPFCSCPSDGSRLTSQISPRLMICASSWFLVRISSCTFLFIHLNFQIVILSAAKKNPSTLGVAELLQAFRAETPARKLARQSHASTLGILRSAQNDKS